MANLIDYYIGKKGRIIVFALRRKGKFYNLLSIIEAFPEGMAPDNEFQPDGNNTYYSYFIKGVDSKADKVFFGVEDITITEELMTSPQDIMYLGGSKILNLTNTFNEEESDWLQLSNSSDEIVKILPKRRTSCKIKIFAPHDAADAHLGTDVERQKIINQIKEISNVNLKFDISKYCRSIGRYIVVKYSPIISNIHLRTTSSNSECICRIIYRSSTHPPLRLSMTAFDKECNEMCKKLVTTNGGFLYEFKFPSPFHHIGLEVKDEHGNIINEYRQVTFLKSIELNFGVKSRDVHYILTEEDTDGNKFVVEEKNVEKYSYEKTVISGDNHYVSSGNDKRNINTEKPESLFDSSPEFTYKKFEDSLDFVFFDGDKERAKENQARAKECVLRILNSAENECYICDIYFNDKTFFEFLTEVQSLSTDIRIISSKENLKEKNNNALLNIIEQSNEKVGHKIECRLLKGDKAALHDRIIIADDKVWMLGCSLNEFGIRATSLIRVPQEYAPKIINGVMQWWNEDKHTEPIKYRCQKSKTIGRTIMSRVRHLLGRIIGCTTRK